MKKNIVVIVGIISLVNCLGCVYYFQIPVMRIHEERKPPIYGANFNKTIAEERPEDYPLSLPPTQSKTRQLSQLFNETYLKSNLNLTGNHLEKPNLSEVFTNFSISFKDLKTGPQLLNSQSIRFQKFVVNLSTKASVEHDYKKPYKPTATTIKPSPNLINPHPYNFTINNASVCSGNSSSPMIIIVVCTAMGNAQARMAIRHTWGSPSELHRWNARLVFLMGTTLNLTLQERVQEESTDYRDIIQENFLDTYRNLTLKSIALLRWVSSYCPSSKYVLKTDDDMYINVKVLRSTLLKIKQTRFLTGTVIVGAKPIQQKKSKWYTPVSDFSQKYYPRYCSGTAYAMSTDLVTDLYHVTLNTRFFWLEDIYITGVCAGKLRAKYIPNRKFTLLHRPATGCAFLHRISGHQVTIEEMHKIWNEIGSANCTHT